MIQYSEESLESRWYREHSIRIHQKRLNDIKSRNFSIEHSPTRFYSVNRRKNRFKQNEVVRENIMLYDKLTMISERKQNKNQAKGPKSLNISIRKKEADRIIQDNFEFVKRLTEKESIFSVRKLRKDFDEQEKYKNSISRHNLHERLRKITDSELRLPPINQEYAKGSSTSRVSNISKPSKSATLSEKEKTPKIKESPEGLLKDKLKNETEPSSSNNLEPSKEAKPEFPKDQSSTPDLASPVVPAASLVPDMPEPKPIEKLEISENPSTPDPSKPKTPEKSQINPEPIPEIASKPSSPPAIPSTPPKIDSESINS